MSKNIGTLANSALAYSQRAQASRLVSTWSESTAEEYQTITNRLLAQVQTLQEKEKSINADSNSSPAGQFKKVKSEVETFITNLRWMRDTKGVLETKVGNLHGNLFILPASTRTETAQGLRDFETRSVIGQMPPNERDNTYLRACESDNVEVLRSLVDAPMPLVVDEVILRGSDERAARIQPKRYKQFIETGELLGEVSAILQDALGLGLEFGLDVPPSVDELGPKIRLALDYAIQHVGARGKKILRTSSKDAAIGA